MVENSYFPAADDWSNWWVNKLSLKRVTTQTLAATGNVYDTALDPLKTIETAYTWTNQRLPDVVTKKITTDGAISETIDTDYNLYGLPKLVTRSTTNELPRVTQMT